MCEGGCGTLSPLLVDRGVGRASCVACGQEARPLSRDETLDRVRGSMMRIFGDDDLQNVHARLDAVREIQDMLRHIETQGGLEPPSGPRLP